MKPIYTVKTIWSYDAMKFDEQMIEVADIMKTANCDVEVQVSMQYMTTKIIWSATLIGRR